MRVAAGKAIGLANFNAVERESEEVMAQIQHNSRRTGVEMAVDGPVGGQFVQVDGVDMYCIKDFDRLPPFLMSIVSDSDHWMYVSTGGGLAAGDRSFERSKGRQALGAGIEG